LTRRELNRSLLRLGLTETQARIAVDVFFDTITRGLLQDKKVSIVGFGSWEWKNRTARTARNPKTGEPVRLLPRKTLIFKPSRSLKTKLNSMNQ